MMHHFYETRVRGMVMSEQDGSIIALFKSIQPLAI